MRRIIPAIVSAAVMCACSSIECPVENTIATYYGLYKSDMTTDTLSDTLSIYTKMADGNLALLFNRGVGITSLALPISYTNAEDTLLFERYDSTKYVVDTVYIAKENFPHFESVDCQLSYFHTITGVRWTERGIDSIVINNPSVSYDSSIENFRVYFKSSL